ncbi:MAG: hypothetical protein KBC48_01430 [Candidatus Pacebacteria bacterium]|nr:hypothetical protein [Candidatus Paceibacterota bacterium]
MSATLAQATQVLGLILEKKGNVKDLQDLLESGLLTDLLDSDPKHISRDAFRQILFLTDQIPSYKIKVDYSVSFEELINRGKYEEVDERLAGNISQWNFWEGQDRKPDVEVYLLPLPHDMQPTAMTQYIRRMGMRELNNKEILTFGIEYPEPQMNFNITTDQILGFPPDDHKQSYKVNLGVNRKNQRSLGLRKTNSRHSYGVRIACAKSF